MSDSLQHELQHTRLPCLSQSPRVFSDSCLLNQWCHPTISSSVIPFSSCLQSFPTSEFFPVNQHFTSGGQSIGDSASASVLPVNIQDWFPLWLTGWLTLLFKGLSRVFSSTTVQKHQFFGTQPLLYLTLTSIHEYWKNHVVWANSLQSCPTLSTLWTVACQSPLSMWFSRQEYWSGLPCPPSGDHPNPRIRPEFLMSPALAGRFFITSITTLTRWTLCFVSKVMPLLFNMLSRLVIAFLRRTKCLFIFWLGMAEPGGLPSMGHTVGHDWSDLVAAVAAAAGSMCSDFEAQEKKFYHCFHCFPIYLPWSNGTTRHVLNFLNVEF